MDKTIKIFLTFLIFSFPIIAKAECSFDFNNLSIDSQTNTDKANIVRLQSILFINNLYSGPITGYYGKMTEKAINDFKTDNGLDADGIVDNDTVSLLCDNYSNCPFQSLLEKNDEYPKQEIKFLQYFLRLIPDIYPEKLVTGFYGSKTENAVKRLQTKLNIPTTGRIDTNTRQKFCNFFDEVDNATLNTKSKTTSSIFQTLCIAFPNTAKTGTSITFISQILGGTAPYKYSWNNNAKYNEKTFNAAFSKAGSYTVNLKITDSKGNTSTSNCKINITGDTITKDSNINWDTFSLDVLDDSSPSQPNIDISIYNKYLYNKRNWSNGWICSLSSVSAFGQYHICNTIEKTKSIYDDILYKISGSKTYPNDLPKNSMVYDSETECKSFCDTKDGDKNTLALNSASTDSFGWVCGFVSQSKCSFLENIESLKSTIGSKQVYSTASECNSYCSKNITATKSTLSAATQQNINSLIASPLNLDCEILPIEVVKNDPIKISIVNMPKWVRDVLDNSLPNKTPGFTWSASWADGIKADLSYGEYSDYYDILNSSNKAYNRDTQKSCKNSSLLVLKNLSPIYCGDGKCTTKESDPKSFSYCRKDCLNAKAIISDSDTSLKPKNTYYNEFLGRIARRRGADLGQANFNTNTNRFLYLSFDKSGTYNVTYSLYATNETTKTSHLMGKANCNINVVDRPSPNKYMRAFLTYQKPETGKAVCPKNFYLLDPKTKELKYITPAEAKFVNTVPGKSIYPYRDLDGGFLSFDWQHLFVKSYTSGGDMWDYGKNTSTYSSQIPGVGFLSVPLIANKKYDRLLTRPIDNLQSNAYITLNRPTEKREDLDLGSEYYQPFSCGNDFIDFGNPNNTNRNCTGYDTANAVLFGYQNNIDGRSSKGWRSGNHSSGTAYNGGNIYSGEGIYTTNKVLARTLCIEDPIKPEPENISKRKNQFYPDLVLSNFKVGNIIGDKREVTIDVTNLGGETLESGSTDGTLKNQVLISCNTLSDGTGTNVGHFYLRKILKPNQTITLNQTYEGSTPATFKCQKEDTRDISNYLFPKLEPNQTIACIVDPDDKVEESNENNNDLINLQFSCN